MGDGQRISIGEIRRLMDVLPVSATRSERLAIRNIFSTVFGRLIAGMDVAVSAAATRAFVTWTSSSAISDAWQSDISRLIEALEPELARDLGPYDHRDDQRVALTLRYL